MKPLAAIAALVTAVGLSLTTTPPPASVYAAPVAELVAPVAASGITGQDRYAPGEPIVLTCNVDAPDGATIARKWYGDGVRLRRFGDGTKVHGWAAPGKCQAECVVAVYSDGKLTVAKYRKSFVVGDPEPPKPLSELVDAETAKSLATYCRLWCEPSVLATVSDGAAFRAAFQSQAEARSLTANKAWPVIVDRVAVIAKDGPLEPLPLTATLQKIATELGVAPTPPVPPTPVPTPGKRQVVIVRESADDTPAQARIFTALRSGAEAGYLKDKGHTLLILDDDDQNSVVAKLKPLMVGPASLFVLDGQTVLANLPLPADAAAVVAAIQANGG